MVLLLFWFVFYVFDGLAAVALIHALGDEELDHGALMLVGLAVTMLSIFLDFMVASEFGLAGLFGACGMTALVLGMALKFVWDVEIKRVVLIGVFFCAFHVGLLRSLMYWLSHLI